VNRKLQGRNIGSLITQHAKDRTRTQRKFAEEGQINVAVDTG
jgi:hypothetical protein